MIAVRLGPKRFDGSYLPQRWLGLGCKSNSRLKRFTFSEVAADWNELIIPQHTMRPSIATTGPAVQPVDIHSHRTPTLCSHH